MQSKADAVDDYMAEAPPERRPWLERVRALCRDTLTGYEEGMAYGMSTYARDRRAEFAFASQKQYLALYLMKPEDVGNNADRLAGLDIGKGCLLYRKPELMDLSLIERLLRDTARDASAAC